MKYTMRFTLRKAISLIFVLLLGFMPTSYAENVGDSLNVGIMCTNTTQLHPLMPVDRDIINVYNLVYESLIVIDDSGMPTPYLAKSFDMSGGGNTIKFEIRDDVFFSDGRQLTAYDIAASGNHILETANNDEVTNKGYYSMMALNIKSFNAENETVLNVQTRRPYFMSLYSLTFPVVPADSIETENPPGSGAYIVDDFQPGDHIWLKANEKWWKERPSVKNILFNFYQNNKKLISDYEYGRLDTAITRSIAAAQYKNGIGSLSIPYRTNQLEMIVLNNSEYRLKDVEARRAIMKAIDVDMLINRVYMGRASRAYTPFPSGSFMFYDLEQEYLYNLEEARQILTNLGWEDTDEDGVLDKLDEENKLARFVLRLIVYEDPENDVRLDTANRIKAMLEQLKIQVNVELVSMEKAQESLVAHSFDMALIAVRLDEAFDPGFLLMSSNGKMGNYGRYRSKEMDKLFENYRTKTDPSELAYTAAEIQKKFTEDMPFIPLYYRMGSILTRKVFTTVRDIRETEVFRGIESFGNQMAR